MSHQRDETKLPIRPFRDGLGFVAAGLLALFEVLWPFGPRRSAGNKDAPVVAGEAEPVELDLSEDQSTFEGGPIPP